MIQGEIKHVTPDHVRKYGLGSVLNGGGSFPPMTTSTPRSADWVALADAYYDASVDRGSRVMRWDSHYLGNRRGPRPQQRGWRNLVPPQRGAWEQSGTPSLIGRIGAATAREKCSATAIDWMFAPTIAVATDSAMGPGVRVLQLRPRCGSQATPAPTCPRLCKRRA